jgi:hypothetical protein
MGGICGDNTDSVGTGLADKLWLKPKIDGQNLPLQGYYSAFQIFVELTLNQSSV